MQSQSLRTALAFAALLLAACGGGDSARTADSAAAQDTSAAADVGAADADDRWDIAASDVDAWVRGLQGGTDSMRIASRHARSLSGSARVKAYSQMIPVAFASVEARASGLGEDRYFEVANQLHDAYNALTGGTPDTATTNEILRHLRPDARGALERQLPGVRRVYAARDTLLAQAGGYDTLPGALK
jgi:hypothetical protein